MTPQLKQRKQVADDIMQRRTAAQEPHRIKFNNEGDIVAEVPRRVSDEAPIHAASYYHRGMSGGIRRVSEVRIEFDNEGDTVAKVPRRVSDEAPNHAASHYDRGRSGGIRRVSGVSDTIDLHHISELESGSDVEVFFSPEESDAIDRDISVQDFGIDVQVVLSPEVSGGVNERNFSRFGLTWRDTADVLQNSHNTHGRKASKLRVMLNDLTSNLSEAQEVADVFWSRMKSILPSTLALENDSSEDTAMAIMANLKNFFNLPQFQSKGTRDRETQHVLYTVWTAILGPSHGYCNTPYGQGPIIALDKDTGMYKIVLSFGTLHVHEDQFYDNTEYYTKSNRLSHRAIVKVIGGKNWVALRKCQAIRNRLSTDKVKPFEEIMPQRKKMWYNFDDEMKDAIHWFCHDPEFVRPDNYNKQPLCCFDDLGEKCKHQRHNWMVNGSIDLQHELFLQSNYFVDLFASLQEKNLLKEITEDYLKGKVSLRKLKQFRSNCIRDETRASCVDPVEAPAYDNARALQLFVRGILSTKPKVQNAYFQQQGDSDFHFPSDSETDDSNEDDDAAESNNADVENGEFF